MLSGCQGAGDACDPLRFASPRRLWLQHSTTFSAYCGGAMVELSFSMSRPDSDRSRKDMGKRPGRGHLTYLID